MLPVGSPTEVIDGFLTYRDREPRRGRDEADPCGAGAQLLGLRLRGTRPRSRPWHCTPRARATRCSCASRTCRYDLGPASARPYIDLSVLERALVETGADAVWPGWGFVAEDPAFVDLCDRLGVTFIGPSAEAMRKLGDKIGSKLIAEEVGVPVAPWSRGAVATLEDALTAADQIGYPLMLKATAGGGGRGIRMVASAADLDDAYQRTSDEALRAFGNGTVFLERLVTGARHVEVQMIADSHGTAWAIGVRDCSIQRRNQKVIEESSSPLLSRAQTDELKDAAERLALAVGYVGAGTVEFLFHPQEQTFAFLEVNTRLQVEHSITEVTTDVDLVKAQIHVAGGGRLEGDRPGERGHAVEARLNAEDPDRDFAPVARSHRATRAADRTGGPGRHGGRRGRHDSLRLRLDDREDHRLRAHPRGRPRPAAPGDERHHRGHRGWRHQQELRARPARPARGGRRHRRLGRHQLDRPGPRRGTSGRPPARRHCVGRGRDRGLRRRAPDRDHPAARDRPRWPAPGSAPRRAADRAQAARHDVPGGDGQHRPVALPGHGRGRRDRADGRGRARPDRRVPPQADRRRPPAPRRHRHPWSEHAGRGGRGRAPGQPRRGRRAPVACSCARGRNPRCRGGGGRRGRTGPGPGVDEDGDGSPCAVRGPGQGAPRHHRQPGRDRHPAGPARTARRWHRGRRGRDVRARAGPAGTAGRRRHRSCAPPRHATPCARSCSATTCPRRTRTARWPSYLEVRDELTRARCPSLPRR